MYGHLVWCECLGDISAVVDAGVQPADAVKMRCRVMEAVRRLQYRHKTAHIRYKQVYVLDLSEISLGSLITSSKVREMTKAIVGGANDFFPETLWKLFIVNAPFVFRSAYSVVSPVIHPTTKEKMKILGSSFLDELERNGVPLVAVPRHLEEADLVAHRIDDPRVKRKIVQHHRRRAIGEGFEVEKVVGVGTAFGGIGHQAPVEVEARDGTRRIEMPLYLEGLGVAPGTPPGP